jgi:hypothetical protein
MLTKDGAPVLDPRAGKQRWRNFVDFSSAACRQAWVDVVLDALRADFPDAIDLDDSEPYAPVPRTPPRMPPL